MNEKNTGPQPNAGKPRHYNRKPRQNKEVDALSQAVQSAIELVKEPAGGEKKAKTGAEKRTGRSRSNNARSQQKAQPAENQPAQEAAPNAAKPKNTRPRTQGRRKKDGKKPLVRIIPLGGLNEIGKNMTVYECGNDMFIVDCGLAFPDETMLGIDIVIPDFTYVVQNKEKIRGVFITHGHEDHIGGIPYLMKEIDAPLYATKLTLGLIKNKLKEHGLSNQVKMMEVKPGDTIKAGCMSVEFIRVNHSIPDACALAIHTPAGVIVQTGDFKVDYTPIEGGVIDLGRFGELAGQHPERAHSGRIVQQVVPDGRRPPHHHCNLCLQHPPHPADYRLCSQVRQKGLGFRAQHGQRGGNRHRAGLPQGSERDFGGHRRGKPPAV